MTRADIRSDIQVNLNDAAITYYSTTELNNSIQDAYNEIVAKTLCNTKTVNLNWVSNKNYYDFLALGVTDFVGVIGIFNLVTNMWLRDDVSLRDYDRLRRDWEIWIGQSQFWAPHSVQYIAIAPKQLIATGQFTLVYAAQAPVFVDDTTAPIIATDMQILFELYCTADLLETAEEYIKASSWWARYYDKLAIYKKRCKDICKSDLLMRV